MEKVLGTLHTWQRSSACKKTMCISQLRTCLETLSPSQDFSYLVRIVFRELEKQFEGASLPWRVIGPEDDCLPGHDLMRSGCRKLSVHPS